MLSVAENNPRHPTVGSMLLDLAREMNKDYDFISPLIRVICFELIRALSLPSAMDLAINVPRGGWASQGVPMSASSSTSRPRNLAGSLTFQGERCVSMSGYGIWMGPHIDDVDLDHAPDPLARLRSGLKKSRLRQPRHQHDQTKP